MQWQTWQDVLSDKSLCNLPYKIELTNRGTIEMSPPASYTHSSFQGELTFLLRTQLGGKIFTKLPVQTEKGVKVPDIAWGSKEYYHNIKMILQQLPHLKFVLRSCRLQIRNAK